MDYRDDGSDAERGDRCGLEEDYTHIGRISVKSGRAGSRSGGADSNPSSSVVYAVLRLQGRASTTLWVGAVCVRQSR